MWFAPIEWQQDLAQGSGAWWRSSRPQRFRSRRPRRTLASLTRQREYRRQCVIVADLEQKVLRMNVLIPDAKELPWLIEDVLAGNDPFGVPDSLIFRPGYKL